LLCEGKKKPNNMVKVGPLSQGAFLFIFSFLFSFSFLSLGMDKGGHTTTTSASTTMARGIAINAIVVGIIT